MVRETKWDQNNDYDRDRDEGSGRDRNLGSGLELGSGSGQVFVLSCFSEIYVAILMDFLDAFANMLSKIFSDRSGMEWIRSDRARSG